MPAAKYFIKPVENFKNFKTHPYFFCLPAWLESRLYLLVKVEKRSCSIKKGLTKVMKFYHTTCIYFSGLLLQGVDTNWYQSSVFYIFEIKANRWRIFTSLLLDVNFLCGDPTLIIH